MSICGRLSVCLRLHERGPAEIGSSIRADKAEEAAQTARCDLLSLLDGVLLRDIEIARADGGCRVHHKCTFEEIPVTRQKCVSAPGVGCKTVKLLPDVTARRSFCRNSDLRPRTRIHC